MTWKKAAAAAALTLVAGAGGVAVSGTTASAAPQTCEQQQISHGARGACAQKVQQLVNICAGNRALVLDGVFGRGTRAAVVTFQKSRGLIGDGIVGPHTWLKLHGCKGAPRVADPKKTYGTTIRGLQHRADSCAGIGAGQRKGQSSPCVRLLQQSLVACWSAEQPGLAVVERTGTFDARTEHVVKVFQHRNKLGVDGVAGPKTWALLDKCNGPAGQGW